MVAQVGDKRINEVAKTVIKKKKKGNRNRKKCCE